MNALSDYGQMESERENKLRNKGEHETMTDEVQMYVEVRHEGEHSRVRGYSRHAQVKRRGGCRCIVEKVTAKCNSVKLNYKCECKG